MAVPDGDGEALRDFLAGKIDEKRMRMLKEVVKQPYGEIDDYFLLLERMFRTVGIPARRFQVSSEGYLIASCLMALTPGWQESALGEYRPWNAVSSPDRVLTEKFETFREQYLEYRQRGIYMVEISDADTEEIIEAGGNFRDMEEAAAYASRLIRDCEARDAKEREAGPEP